MRAILPGRPQSKRQAVCTAHWDGLRLVAYVSGSTVVVLRNPKDIVQTISIDHVEALSAVIIDESSGRIAICDERHVLVFDAVGREQGDLRWTQTQDITVPDNGRVRSLSWGSSEELLVGGTNLWLYHIPDSDEPRIIWEQPLANEVFIAYFSNDAELIASCGAHDRLVKIWRRLSFELDSTRFDVSYLPHPAAVTDLHWRNPWHKEQNLDTLLYTICSDNQVRVWTYSDPHSLSVVQLIATIDANKSIEPRRRSIGSISRKRYVFIFDSRDFSNATEKAVQNLRNRSVDHALEHLVEIANRSPELCIVFDGLGHMSVWGLENAGWKTKKPIVVFNVTLVDQVDVQLRFDQDDYIKLCAFGGGLNEASLSLLVHSYTGQVDWYESPIAHFFDTASRKDRVELLSSWSGHDSAIDHIARGSTGERILSWTDEGQAILWSQSQTGALRRQCELNTDHKIVGVILLDSIGQVLVLHPTAMSLWDVASAHGTEIASKSITNSKVPLSFRLVNPSHQGSATCNVALFFKDASSELWQVSQPRDEEFRAKLNGNHSPLSKMSGLKSHLTKIGWPIPCDVVGGLTPGKKQELTSANLHVDEDGQITRSDLIFDTSTGESQQKLITSTQTNVTNPTFVRASSSGKCALVANDGKCLTIWDLHQGVCEWRYRHEGTDEIQKLAWTSTSKGNLFLFVGFSYSAMFVGQFRYPAVSTHQSAWYITQNISLRDFTTNHIGDICWLPSGDIAVAAGHQIFVLENIITQRDSPIVRSQQLVDSKSAAAVIDMACAALPVFRADFLEASIMSHGLEQAEHILHKLYEKLKYFSEGDELPSDLDLSMTEIISDVQHSSMNATGKVNGTGRNDHVHLEDVEDSFNEYLEGSEIWQLSPRRRKDISVILTNLIKLGRYRKSLDENGLRYLYALYNTPEDRDLPWSAFVFASRSTSQEALVDLIMQQHDGKITWSTARRVGLFVWLEDLIALQTQFENIARTEYNKSEDRNPVDCSLYYLALNKKSVLQSLWRMTYGSREKENTMKLLANNFDIDRWKATALKNAYALLSKRRFEYAAAFFLLGSSLKDAVNVCVNQLKDVQLAIAVARVWDKNVQQSEDVLHDLLQRHVLTMAIDSEQGRWMAAWAYSLLQNPTKAMQSLVRPLHEVIGVDHDDEDDGPTYSMSFRANDPHLNVLYTQFRNAFVKQNKWTSEVLTQREEWEFVLRCANWRVRAGMDYLAVQLLKEWVFVPHQEPRRSNAPTTLVIPVEEPVDSEDVTQSKEDAKEIKKKPPPTQFYEPSADSLLDSFGF